MSKMRGIRRVSAILSCVLAFIGGAYAAETKPTVVSGLLSASSGERFRIQMQLTQERSDLIKQLIGIVEMKDVDTSFEGPLYRAIELLGKLRAEEAVRALSGRLGYLPTGPVYWEIAPREAYYPAARALHRIGFASVGSMMVKIEDSDSAEERNLAAWVIMEVEGSKEIAAYRIDLAIKRGDLSKKAVERLEEAKQFILTYKPDFDYPELKKQPAAGGEPGK